MLRDRINACLYEYFLHNRFSKFEEIVDRLEEHFPKLKFNYDISENSKEYLPDYELIVIVKLDEDELFDISLFYLIDNHDDVFITEIDTIEIL